MTTIQTNSRTVNLDGEGYLEKFDEWDKDVGLALAKEEGIDITDDHWVVARLLRDFYKEHAKIPTTKELVTSLRKELGEAKGTSKYLSQLFPNEPAKQSAKIAGLPRMPGCT